MLVVRVPNGHSEWAAIRLCADQPNAAAQTDDCGMDGVILQLLCKQITGEPLCNRAEVNFRSGY